MKTGLFGLLMCACSMLFAQGKYTLSGYVKDEGTGEDMIGANVYLQNDPGTGASTNGYGFFSMTLPEGDYNVVISYVGYDNQIEKVSLHNDVRLNVQLSQGKLLEEVVVKAERGDVNIQSTDMGKVELNIEQIKTIPVLFGEVDILKTIQLLPGVGGAGEGNTGFYVRGGGPDQNLILLDEAVVYNTGHLFGFFSVFNSDAIKNVTLVKGGMPSQYGGRLSSVLDVQMKEGNNQYYQAEGGIGLIASRLTIQGPIVKDKSSFIVSGRRTYIDALITPFLNGTDFEGNGYYFYDLNTKVNYTFDDKNRIFASGYFGQDVFNYSAPDGSLNVSVPWGNATGTVRWNHLFNNKLFMNVSAIYNSFNFSVQSDFQDFNFNLYSGIQDWNGKVDFDYYPGSNHHIKFGANYVYHTFTPYSAQGSFDDVDFSTDTLSNKYAHETGIFIQDEFDVTDRLKINIGLRGSYFAQVGPYNDIVYDENGATVIDTIYYAPGEMIAHYSGLEPRFNMRFTIDPESSLKAGITYNNQYIHLVSSSTSTLPTDLWIPSSDIVKPQIGIQYALGYFRNFKDNAYETSIEVYYKDLRNQIEFRDGYVPELGLDIEDNFVFGVGRSYGAEIFLKKAKGKFNGWIGYTLSKTERKFEDLSTGSEWFPTKYDRVHDLEVVAVYNLSDRWDFSSTFVYATGQATTIVESFYVIGGQVQTDYGPRNGYRLPAYHRLDVSATLHSKPERKYESSWNFSIYNVYSRKNPYFIYTTYEGDFAYGYLDVQAKQVSIFPIIPSVTWNFKFAQQHK
ncbi:MAG TPA: TonB-dependent receptor [Chitinophagales bacterium]|nr:TonB-dependent receptor [Chitinophagales bacterium]HNE45885.1 TonB-dependent receptor [Chitinophagales bacterium]HNF68509.1 TonB-dependent receptor [Chitinophagales bacterium]HNI55312.1 TonB-dependent receptor [Chitinophagales bacterium]HNJ89874.1 TonB-dependent receptor [Chitinophagales bacterium]